MNWGGAPSGSTTSLTASMEHGGVAAPYGTTYYASDHLGTAQMELSALGYPVWKGEFAPFGQELSDPSSTTNRYKFTGKERDAESGLDYFGARYYSSTVGRWMSPDWAQKAEPVPYAKMDNPQSLNLYGYVGNNPITQADADGHCVPWCSAAIGALVGGGASIIAQKWSNPHGDLNWRQVGAAALGGAVAGGTLGVLTAPAAITTLTGTTVVGTASVATTAGGGAIGGMLGGIAERAANGEGASDAMNPTAMARDAAVGAAGEILNAGVERAVEGAAGGAARAAQAKVNRITPRTSSSAVRNRTSAAHAANSTLHAKTTAATAASSVVVNVVDKAIPQHQKE